MTDDYRDILFAYRYPRLQGVKEQHYRCEKYFKMALEIEEQTEKYRYLVAAIYPARAIIEIMLESVVNEEIKQFKTGDAKNDREAFEKEIVPKLPYYYLIEKIRIHDFHRFGIVPPGPRVHSISMSGKKILTARSGGVKMQLKSNGIDTTITGNSSIKDQRSLFNVDGLLLDDESGEMVSLENVLECYLEAVPRVIEYYEALVKE